MSSFLTHDGSGPCSRKKQIQVEGQTCVKSLQSWARDNFIASRQQQRDNVIEPQEQEKN